MRRPRIMISALRGGSGKTIVSIGIIAALRAKGSPVSPFKKGPDYIDAGWLGMSAGRPCYNLDTFLMPRMAVVRSFLSHSSPEDTAVIEGNRGLYDGIDISGTTSTAELAKLIQSPVLLCLDCTKTTRTMAAVVDGLRRFDPEVKIEGIVLNRVAGPRHESILRRSIETHTGIPILGALPKLKEQHFPERHMGLIPTPEHDWAQSAIEKAARVAQKYLDLGTIEDIARKAAPFEEECVGIPDPGITSIGSKPVPSDPFPRIGIIRDSAFQFYYPENLEALEEEGAELVYLSPLSTSDLPPIDGLYLGGGFPETHVDALSRNTRFRDSLKSLAENGLPIYAECGGLMYLGRALVLEGTTYPMVGLLPVVYGFSKRPQGHGYTILKVERENPYFPLGSEIRGHEFHYSRVSEWLGSDTDLVFRMERGAGFHNGRDGVSYRNVLALYTHMHALGTPAWAKSMVRNARLFREKTGGPG